MTKIERITSIEEQIRQLENRRKRLLQEHKSDERKARTKRLCSRAGLIEKILPDTIMLSDECFESFVVSHIANRFGIAMLNKLKAAQEKEGGETETASDIHERTQEISEHVQPKQETPKSVQPKSEQPQSKSEPKPQKLSSLAELPKGLYAEDESGGEIGG